MTTDAPYNTSPRKQRHPIVLDEDMTKSEKRMFKEAQERLERGAIAYETEWRSKKPELEDWEKA